MRIYELTIDFQEGGEMRYGRTYRRYYVFRDKAEEVAKEAMNAGADSAHIVEIEVEE